MTVHRLLSDMPALELAKWKAYFVLKAEEQEEQEMIRSAESGAEERRWRR